MAMTFGGNPTPSDVARSTQPNTFTENQTIVGSVSATQTVFTSGGDSDQWNTAYATATEYSSVSSTFASTASANTFTENQTFDGTNNIAPNQTAASGSSLMTRDLVQESVLDVHTPRRFVLRPEGYSYVEVATNGGSFSSGLAARGVGSGTNPAGTAIRYIGVYNPQFWGGVGSPNGGANAGIDWSKRTEFRFETQLGTFVEPQSAYVRFGQTRSTATLGPNGTRGVGLTVNLSGINGFVHNGTSLTVQPLTAYSQGQHYFKIISLGTGVVEFWVDRNLCWTTLSSEGPTVWGGQENTQFSYMVENNGATQSTYIAMFDCYVTIYE